MRPTSATELSAEEIHWPIAGAHQHRASKRCLELLRPRQQEDSGSDRIPSTTGRTDETSGLLSPDNQTLREHSTPVINQVWLPDLLEVWKVIVNEEGYQWCVRCELTLGRPDAMKF